MNQKIHKQIPTSILALALSAVQINVLHAENFFQQPPEVYDGTNRHYETPPVGGWEAVLEAEELAAKQMAADQDGANSQLQKDNAWDVPQARPAQEGGFSVLRNNQGARSQGNAAVAPYQPNTWSVPESQHPFGFDPVQQGSGFATQGSDQYTTQQDEAWSAPQPGNAWSVPQPQQGGFYSVPQATPGVASQGGANNMMQQNRAWDAMQPANNQREVYTPSQNTAAPAQQAGGYDMPQQNRAWDAMQPANNQREVYTQPQNTAAPTQQAGGYNMPTQNATRGVPQVQQQQQPANNAVPPKPTGYAPQAKATPGQSMPGQSSSGQSVQGKAYDMPQRGVMWDNPQVTQGIWDNRAGGPRVLPGYRQGYGPNTGGRRYGTPGFGGTNFEGPWNNGSWGNAPWSGGNSGRNFMPWSRRN